MNQKNLNLQARVNLMIRLRQRTKMKFMKGYKRVKMIKLKL